MHAALLREQASREQSRVDRGRPLRGAGAGDHARHHRQDRRPGPALHGGAIARQPRPRHQAGIEGEPARPARRRAARTGINMQDGDELGGGVAVQTLLRLGRAAVEITSRHSFDAPIEAAPESEQAGGGAGRVMRAACREDDRRAGREDGQQPFDHQRVCQPVGLQGLLVAIDRHAPARHVLDAGIGSQRGKAVPGETGNDGVGERDRRGERGEIERQDVEAPSVGKGSQRRRFCRPPGTDDDPVRRVGEQHAHEFEADPRCAASDEVEDGHSLTPAEVH